MNIFHLLVVRNELSKCGKCNITTPCCMNGCEIFDRAVKAKDTNILEVDVCRGCSQYNNSCCGYEYATPYPSSHTTTGKGTLFTASIRTASSFGADEIWLITRSGNNIPGFKHIIELAPSEMLFRKYLTSWKGKPEHTWWEKYRAQYFKQFQEPGFILKLALLYEKVMKQGLNIVLACFCEREKYCHRSLIASYLAKKGLKVQNH